MKKIKLFALAVFAMMSTNAFAAVGDKKAAGNYRYEVTDATAGSEKAKIIGFVAGLEQAAVVIPSTVADPDVATITYKVTAVGGNFAGREDITSVTIPDENVTTIDEAAFKGCANLATITIGKAVTTIGAEAFMNCAKLATVTINARTATTDPALAIDVKAFEGTAITELDLTNSKMVTLNPLFTHNESGTWTKNKKLSTIKLPKTLTTIAPNALRNCMLVETIDFSACTEDLTISANAFDNTIFLEALELPACVANLADNALAGSAIATLTINSHKDNSKPIIGAIGGEELKTIIVKGAFKGVFGNGSAVVSSTATSLTFKGAVGDGTNAAINSGAFDGDKLATVTFEGEVKANAIATGAFCGATKLATVDFQGNLAAGAVAAGAFGDASKHAGSALGAGKMLTVKYNPTEAAATKVASFNQTAFAPSTGTPVAALATATWYSTWISTNYTGGEIYGLTLRADAATKDIPVANNGEGKYYYGVLTPSDNYKIAASQNGGKVMVYAAYMDQVKSGSTVTNTAYMDQLHIIGGYYWIPSTATAVVVKSTTAEKVVAEVSDGSENSMHYSNASTPADLNQIKVTTEELLGQELMNMYSPFTDGKNYDVYFLAPFEEYGLLWTKFKATRTLPSGSLYLIAPKAAASAPSLNVVWLDGSEEDQTTAIETVKNVVEDDAIYNLAGQKVSASYKGVVIKNGKKMIQK